MPISIQHRGDLKNIERFTQRMTEESIFKVLDAAGRIGVDALAAATPKATGATASMWSYQTENADHGYTIHWTNDHVVRGFSVVIGLQMGHGTGTGGYVVGRDFINPALRPIFDVLADTVWREVQNA